MSLRWWWASRMTGRCTRWERWLPGSGGMFKVLNWNLHSFRLLEIIQVLDSISWVRCASGNVFDQFNYEFRCCFDKSSTLSIYRLVGYLFLLEYLVSALPRYLKEDKFFKENTLYKDCYQVRELLQEVLSKLEVKV